jgi:hypothetical protein
MGSSCKAGDKWHKSYTPIVFAGECASSPFLFFSAEIDVLPANGFSFLQIIRAQFLAIQRANIKASSCPLFKNETFDVRHLHESGSCAL